MSTPSDESILQRTARLPFLPALMHMDARFSNQAQALAQLNERMAHLHADLAGGINFWGQRHERLIHETGAQIRADVQTAIQAGAFAERTAEEVVGLLDALEQRIGGTAAPTPRRGVREHELARADRLFAYDGPVAEAGLWFNPPVVLQRDGHRFTVGEIHERIVEVPFVFRTLARAPAGGRVLDVGSAESTVAFSLAALGFRTIALDPRGYPLPHPRLQAVQEDIARWAGPGEGSLDAIVCLSTLEHLGLKAYGAPSNDGDLDRHTMSRFLSWLKPGGLLALTAPFGRRAVSDFERTYDSPQIDELLAGWTVQERAVYAREGSVEWNLRAEDAGPWPEGLRGVVMIAATRA